jgi:hypothetical protein
MWSLLERMLLDAVLFYGETQVAALKDSLKKAAFPSKEDDSEW